jgi:hypothetical protein
MKLSTTVRAAAFFVTAAAGLARAQQAPMACLPDDHGPRGYEDAARSMSVALPDACVDGPQLNCPAPPQQPPPRTRPRRSSFLNS